MNRRVRPGFRGLGVGVVVTAAILSLVGVPVTSAQGTTLFPVRVDRALPVDAPFDPAWDAVRPLEVALSGQAVVPPMRPEPAFPSVRVRSLFDGERIAFLLEWDDPTLDDSVLAVDAFADAAAIQFALGSGTSLCMGQQAGGLNIWHWKADWAADLNGRRDVQDVHPGMPQDAHIPLDKVVDGLGPDGFLTGQAAGNPRSAASLVSSVEDLDAVGFGTLTPQSSGGQNVHGASEHRGGVWRVAMSRPMVDGDPNDAALPLGGSAVVVAVAIWDGSRGDRDGQKSVSTWLALSMPQTPLGLLDMWPFLFLLVTALILSGLVMAYGSRQPADGLGWPHGRPDGGGSGAG
jgi:hypothetical protein